MNTTSHSVAPEGIMAYLDGELSESEAKAVAAHLEVCEECAGVAVQFRSTSEWLSRWTVPPMPEPLEESIKNLIVDAGQSRRPARRAASRRSAIWNWNLWAFGGGGILTAVLLLLFVASSVHRKDLHNAYMQPKAEMSLTLPSQSRQFDRLDRAAKPMAPPKIKLPDLLTKGETLATLQSDVQTTPMIARTVSITVIVKDFAGSRSSLDALLARHHGYSARLSVSTPENGPRALDGSLRIPAPDLNAALGELRSLGRVENETQAGEEVTQQHADLVARLQTARETEERFRAILQQRTGNVSDVLEVEEGIARVRGEIETMEAEQKTLEHRVDFATVDIQLNEEFKARLDSPSDSVSTRMHNAFVAGYRNASETILGIVLFFEEYGPALLIWLVFLGTPVALVWRRYRRARARF